MSESSIHRWHEGALHPLEYCDMTDTAIEAADSWLVDEGTVLALELHRQRFFAAALATSHVSAAELDAFWGAAIDAIPASGLWFPRVELQRRGDGSLLVLRRRSAPELTRSVRLASHPGPDPRRFPTVKGPDTQALLRARTEAQQRGADEAVLLSPEGFVVEGAYSALLWWRGDVLCAPSLDLDRVDSVTARSVIALATALGIDVYYDSVTPAELDGCEIWALSALHGIRIVTAWTDGPAPAEEPGRLWMWRSRLDRLRRAIPQSG
jgi:branched-subunit amino acid aminotransferase/4-amino-4-deoxychorismate lyase